MATSATHTRKKQLQAPITSYFDRKNDSSRIHRMSTTLSPSIPEETQAGLLSVGMRVRKSIPEGYKTLKRMNQTAFAHTSSFPASTVASPSAATTATQRELMPFCGLHKTGGWAMQPIPSSSAPAILQSEDYDDDLAAPGLSSSQATISSTQESFLSAPMPEPNTMKRSYEDEAEDDLDGIFDEIDAHIDLSMHTHTTSRRMARLKSSVPNVRIGNAPEIASTDDFEEAAFLTPSEGMDLD